MTVMNVLESKTKLSQLLAAAERGEDVVIARNGVPAVRLVPVAPPERVFGADPAVTLPDDSPFFDELPEAELAAWE
jgi:prevent-host-death family protein